MSSEADHIIASFKTHVDARAKETLRRLSYQFVVYVERFIDDHGPEPGSGRAGAHIGTQHGGITRALIPQQPGNITRIFYESGTWQLSISIDQKLVPHASIQEHGGTITPKNAKNLLVPVSPEAAHALESAGGNVRSLNLVVIPKKDGSGAYLAKIQGDKVEPWFALRKSVTIKARPYFEPGVRAFYRDAVPRAFEEFLANLAHDWRTL